MQIDDRPLGLRGGEVEREGEQSNGYQTSGHLRQRCFGRLKREARVKRSIVDEQAAGERPTSTRCRFCGFEEGADEARTVREKPHLQVVVACGSCGHPFAVLSRN